MRVLALDATTRRGSVALADGGVVVDERPGEASRSHAERLPGELLALLDARGWSLATVDLFAVASGPGSFTGLRIGIATMQGLAFVGGRPIVGVSTLDAVAHVGGADAPKGAIVGAWIDAQRGEIFSALYRVTGAGAFVPEHLAAIEPASVGEPAATLARWRAHVVPSALIVAGDGAARYGDPLRECGAADIRVPSMLAGAIARLGAVRAARGEALTAAGVRPEYVRRPDAEIDRDKREAATPRP